VRFEIGLPATQLLLATHKWVFLVFTFFVYGMYSAAPSDEGAVNRRLTEGEIFLKSVLPHLLDIFLFSPSATLCVPPSSSEEGKKLTLSPRLLNWIIVLFSFPHRLTSPQPRDYRVVFILQKKK
jgi:hypothetical protein